jgi:putative endonuclease
MLTRRQEIGQAAEDLAAAFLQSKGLELVLRNYRRRLGELDLVAREGDVLIVAEVRTRASNSFGGAAASVDRWKQQRIIRATTQLLQRRKDLARLRVRFDVIVVFDPSTDHSSIEWIRHAFET